MNSRNHIKIQKPAIFVEKILEINMLDINNIAKLGSIAIMHQNIKVLHSMCNLKYIVLTEIPVVFNNGSNYHNHFIIKELVEEFEKQFNCLREKTEKYLIFSAPIEKEVIRIDKSGKD